METLQIANEESSGSADTPLELAQRTISLTKCNGELAEVKVGASAADWWHWELGLELGEHLVPIVWDTTAPIAPTSVLKSDKLGKAVAMYGDDDLVRGVRKWTTMQANSEQVGQWSKDRRLSLGVQCRVVRAIDVDVKDAKLAAEIAAVITKHVTLPKRGRANSPTFLQPFLLEGTYKKGAIKTVAGNIEFLADGQQFVAAGRHKSGVMYEWEGGRPMEIPRLTPEQFEALWRDLAERFGIEPVKPAREVSSTVGGDVRSTITDAQLADLTYALKHPQLLHDAGDENVCSEVGMSLRSLGDVGEELFLEFCARADNFDQDWAESWWLSHAGMEIKSDFLHIYNMATARGWVNPATQSVSTADDFTALRPDAAHEAAAVNAAKLERFTPIPADEFEEGAPLEWRIENVIPDAELVVLYGEPGCGKSFLALDMAGAMARGVPWRGLDVKPGRVVYVCAEGAAGFRKRIKAYKHQHAVQLPGLRVMADAPNLLEKADALAVARQIIATGGADVVIVDTLSAVTPGGDENSGEDMGLAIDHCKGIHRATGAVVILIHHSGKDPSKGTRGSTKLPAAADMVLAVTRSGDTRTLVMDKNKDGPDDAKLAFKLLVVPLGEDAKGKPITSCVVEHLEVAPEQTRARKDTLGAREQHVLNAVRDLLALADSVSVEAAITAGAGRLAQDPQKRDRRREYAREALDALHLKGYFRIADGRITWK
jgi:energy-coupling factor transporter ATP-binding protein EcfA2